MPNVFLQALSSQVSDHCPLLITGRATVKRFNGFRFESFWPKLPGFQQVVQDVWERGISATNPFLRLHIKLQRTARALRRWARGIIWNNRLLLCAADKLIGVLDVVQEFRPLSDVEIRLRQDLKARFLGMTAVEKLRAKQQSQLISIRAAEANQKLFFMQANGRRRKNAIHSLQYESGILHMQEDMELAVFQHFQRHFDRPAAWDYSLNWDELNLPRFNLEHLEQPFTDEEVHTVVLDTASEKAPGPDGYIGLFLKICWPTIRTDVMSAFHFLYLLHDQHLQHLNTAHIVLIPKKPDAMSIADYRPISLTHIIAKLFSKCLAARLAPELNAMVSRAQSAFIKRRSIQDNFIYTQNQI
jgi:hypothetical protein